MDDKEKEENEEGRRELIHMILSGAGNALHNGTITRYLLVGVPAEIDYDTMEPVDGPTTPPAIVVTNMRGQDLDGLLDALKTSNAMGVFNIENPHGVARKYDA